MYEHGEPSGRFPVVDLTLEEEDDILDTSRDEEIVRKLFGDLNRGLLRLPDDGNIIVLSDSEEVHKDDHPMMKLRHHLLETHRLQTPLPPTTMMHSTRCKMIVMMVEMRPVHLSESPLMLPKGGRG
jgi:hypothetical protein